MSTFSSQNFKIGPCTVIFKDEVLGETQGTSLIKVRSKYHTFTNDQITGIPIIRQLQNISVFFETELLAVDKGFNMLLDTDKKITMEEINWMREPDAGELKLIPVNPLDTVGYRFPRALLLRNSDLSINEDEEHTLRIEFEAVYDENELMIEEITISDADRINLNISTPIEPDALERAITNYIAGLLNLTVDTDIFRGGLPTNIDGCAVELRGEKIHNSIMGSKFHIKFTCIEQARDRVMKRIHTLANCFPVYGENLVLDGGDNVSSKVILKKSAEYNRTLSDDGKIKTLGELSLLVIT